MFEKGWLEEELRETRKEVAQWPNWLQNDRSDQLLEKPTVEDRPAKKVSQKRIEGT